MKKYRKTTKELYKEISPALEEIVKRIEKDPDDSENRGIALLLGAMAMAAGAIPKSESERVVANRKFEDMMSLARNTPRGAF